MDLFEKCRRFDRTREAEAAGVYPYFIPIESTAGPEVTINGRSLVMLGSNNYLGLTHHPHVQEAMVKAIERFGSACTGSRLLNGTLEMHEELERRLAAFIGKEAALVFTTGFQTNLGTISAVVGRHDAVVIDRVDHASIVDGCRLALGKTIRYQHNDLEDLERVLAARDPSHGTLIVVDGVFSMEGDLVDLPGIVRLKNQYGARLMVDDSHAVGVFGKRGTGVPEHFGLSDEVDLIMGTFSKSFASIGGFIAGPADVIYYIKHTARALIFSASLPPSSTAAALAALDIIESEPDRRARLWASTRKMKAAFDAMGLDTGPTQSPIVPILVGDTMRLAFFWRKLFDSGVFANAAVPPSVEPGRALIRTSYMATHTDEQLDRALERIERAAREFGLVSEGAAEAGAGVGRA